MLCHVTSSTILLPLFIPNYRCLDTASQHLLLLPACCYYIALWLPVQRGIWSATAESIVLSIMRKIPVVDMERKITNERNSM